eukprot:238292-Rhodomonas_salina.3
MQVLTRQCNGTREVLERVKKVSAYVPRLGVNAIDPVVTLLLRSIHEEQRAVAAKALASWCMLKDNAEQTWTKGGELIIDLLMVDPNLNAEGMWYAVQVQFPTLVSWFCVDGVGDTANEGQCLAFRSKRKRRVSCAVWFGVRLAERLGTARSRPCWRSSSTRRCERRSRPAHLCFAPAVHSGPNIGDAPIRWRELSIAPTASLARRWVAVLPGIVDHHAVSRCVAARAVVRGQGDGDGSCASAPDNAQGGGSALHPVHSPCCVASGAFPDTGAAVRRAAWKN